jgi:hypothetical protein
MVHWLEMVFATMKPILKIVIMITVIVVDHVLLLPIVLNVHVLMAITLFKMF